MANLIKLRRSAVTGTVPTTAQLELGELAINTHDGKLFLKRDNGIGQYIVEVGGNLGFEVKNQTGSTIPKGTVLKFAGTLGASGKLLAAPFLANNTAPSEYVIGLAENDILNGDDGFAIDHGKILQLNTSAFSEGAILYASASVSGGLTATRPAAPNNKVIVAAVVRSHATTGILEIKVVPGSALDNDELVELGTLASNDALIYNSTAGRFENRASTGTDNVVLSNSPVLVTPTLGAASATSINASLGAVGTPSYTFTGDTNTGMWSPSADTLAFSEGGTEVMRINSSGNVGIGTSSPDANAKLDVAGTVRSGAGGSDPGTGAVFYLVGSGSFQTVIGGAAFAVNTGANNARTERMRIASDGTTTLNVGGVSSTHQFNYNESGGEIQLIDSTGAGPILLDNVSGLARLYKVGTGAMSIGTTGENYLQYVTNSAERMRITSGGNVGIGTSSPSTSQILTLNSGGTATPANGGLAGLGIINTDVTASGTTGILGNLTDPGGTGRHAGAIAFGKDGTWTTGSAYPGNIQFWTRPNSTGNEVERMRIDSSGNVGIGVTPLTRLDVSTSGGSRIRTDTGNSLLVTQFVTNAAANAYVTSRTDAFDYQIYTGGSEKVRIDSSGKVGIGESAPGAKLHVSGGTVGTTAGNLLNVTIDQGLAGGNAVGVRTNLVRVSSGTDWTTTAMRLQGRVDATNFGYIDLVSGGAQGIAFGSDTSERMRIDSSGNVGIGTSAPGYKLQVNGFVGVTDGTSTVRLANSGGVGLVSTVTNHPLAFQTNDAERMRITSAGNVGIGTSAPSFKLDIQGSSAQTARVYCTDSASGSYAAFNAANANGVSSVMYSYSGAGWYGTTSNHPTLFLSNNAERMRIDSSGNVGIGTAGGDFSRAWRLVARQDQNAITHTGVINGNTGASAAAQFSKITGTGNSFVDWGLADNSGSPYDTFSYGSAVQYVSWGFGGAERFRITSAGNVGIGTTAPGASTRLNVNGRGLFTGGSYDPGDSTASGVSISYDTGSNIGIIGAIQTGVTEREMRMRGNTLTFFTNGANERMRVTETGNIGIGTTAAAQRLHVRQDQNGTTAAIIQNRNATGSPASALQFISGAFDLSDNRYAMISSAGGSNTTLQFWTAAGASPTQKMVITSAGNVGIGVTAPPQLLAVGNATDQVGAGVSGAVSTLYFGSPSNGSGGIKRLAYDRASGALTFIGGGVVDPSTQMTIASGGEITAAVDFRAPIFYDSNDTGKYLNPNGSSFLIGTTVITRDSNSNDVFGGLELRENNVQGAATGAANEAPGINFHWSMRGAARIYMNGAGNFVFAGQSDITNNRRDIIFASGYAATRVDAPIFRDSDNTAFFFDGASTTNINTLNGNGKQIFNTGDSYLRINETSAFTNGCWFGGSLLQGGGFYTGSNGGTTNSRVAIIGGTFNGTNVITLDGSNGRITASDIRAPIFYDTDNTGFYVNPAGDTNLNKTFTYLGGKDVNANWNTGFQNTPTQSYNFHGDVSSGGPAGAWWFYESMRHSNGANYWGTQIAWGWEDNANRLFQRNITSNTFSGWVEYLNTSNRTYNGNLNMTGSIISTSSDVRAPVFYDQNDTGYYVDPNSGTSAVFVGDVVMGAELNMVVGTRGDRYIDVKGDLYFRYSDNSTFYNSRMLIRQSGAILSYADFESSGNITAYASDRRLKTNIVPIKNALQKLLSIGGYTFDWDMDKCEQHGFTPTQVHEHGVIAQEIEEIMPDVVVHAPFDKETRPNHDMSASRSGEWFKTVNYDKIVPLLIEAIKEQQAHINKMQQEIEILKGDK